MDVQKNNKALFSSDEKRRKLQGNKLHQKKSNKTIDSSAILCGKAVSITQKQISDTHETAGKQRDYRA